MIIKELTVTNTIDDKEIRKIKFNDNGLSLIVDESDLQKSGSNIGKTTAVKIIDICLGSKHKSSIYSEKDTGENLVIKNFIQDKKVEAELKLEIDGEIYSLRRALYPNGKNYLDDDSLRYDDYKAKLNKLIFNNDLSMPSLSQLIRKFVRLDTNNEEALFKFIGYNTKNPAYQAIYNYLFGISEDRFINVSIDDQNEKIDKDIEAILRKNAVTSLDEFSIKIELLKEELNKFEIDYKKLSIVDDYEKIEGDISELLNQINNLESGLSVKRLNVEVLKEKIEKETSRKFSVDHRMLEAVYENTKVLMKEPLMDFKDLETFHNSMIENRITLLKNSLKELEANVLQSDNRLQSLRRHYESNYVSFNTLLREKFEEKYKKYSDNKVKLDTYLSDYNYIISKNDDKKQNNTKKVAQKDNKSKKDDIEDTLNKYFEKLTYEITGETYRLLLNLDENSFPIQAVGLNGKPGTGIKKALIACFDMAHINLIIDKNLHMPHFIIHDKLENIDLKELTGIVAEARKFRGQYIFPILSDRIDILNINAKEIVLRLSSEDKFFKV